MHKDTRWWFILWGGNKHQPMPLFMHICQSPLISGDKALLPMGSLQACVSQQVWASPGNGCVWTPYTVSHLKLFFIKILCKWAG